MIEASAIVVAGACSNAATDPDLTSRVAFVLADLDDARKPSDLDLPGYHLHPLKGALKGFWSISVSGNWRMILRFDDGDAYDVDLVDHHWQEAATWPCSIPRTPDGASRRTVWTPST